MKVIALFFVGALVGFSGESSAQTVQNSQPDRSVIPLAEPEFEGSRVVTFSRWVVTPE